MKNKFPRYCSLEQAKKIDAVFYNNNEDGSLVSSYNVGDIFNCLPHSITYDGHRGDLCVTPVDIAYFSVNGDWKHILVHHEPIPLDGDIYDAFLNMAEWLKENNLI